MTHINKVLEVANPHVIQSFKMFKGPDSGTLTDAVQSLGISAKIHMDNSFISGVIQSVNTHRNEQPLEMKRLVNLDLTNKVVVSCPICFNYMVGNETLDKVKHIIVTRHQALDDRVIVLDMADDTNSALVEYNLTMVAADDLAENVMAELLLTAQFYLVSKHGTDYRCTYPE